MHTVSLFLYEFHFEIVAFFVCVRARHAGSFSGFVFSGWFRCDAAANCSEYLYECVFVLLLIGFQFMSPGWCIAFVYYSRSSSPLSLLLLLLFIFKCILILTNLATRCDFGQSHRTRITDYFHQTKANNLWFWFNGAREYIWTIRFGKGWPNTAILKILSYLAVHTCINEIKRIFSKMRTNRLSMVSQDLQCTYCVVYKKTDDLIVFAHN